MDQLTMCPKQLLTLVLFFWATSLAAAELRVPAFTAYTLPNAEGARISERSGVTRWTDPALSVNWYGRFQQTGEVTAKVELRLPKDAESKLKLTVAGQSRELAVKGAGGDTVDDRGLRGLHHLRSGLSTVHAGIAECSGPAVRRPGTLYAGWTVRLSTDAHFNLKERRNAASVHLIYPVPADTNVAAFYCEVTAVEDPTATFYMACGWHRGYFGMQVNSPTERRIIFSVWDSGNEAVDRDKVAEENRVQLVSKGEGVFSGDFGNEGTGGHSHLKYTWKTGETTTLHRHGPAHRRDPHDLLRLLLSSRQAGSGCSSLPGRHPRKAAGCADLHSFSENFWGSNGHLVRKALYGNQWIRTDDGRLDRTDDGQLQPRSHRQGRPPRSVHGRGGRPVLPEPRRICGRLHAIRREILETRDRPVATGTAVC